MSLTVPAEFYRNDKLPGLAAYDEKKGLFVIATNSNPVERLKGLQTAITRLFDEATKGHGALFGAFVNGLTPDTLSCLKGNLTQIHTELEAESKKTPHWLVFIAMTIWNLFANCFGFAKWEAPDYTVASFSSRLDSTLQAIEKSWFAVTYLKGKGAKDLLAPYGEPNLLFATDEYDDVNLFTLNGEVCPEAGDNFTTSSVQFGEEKILEVDEIRYRVQIEAPVCSFKLVAGDNTTDYDLTDLKDNHELLNGIYLQRGVESQVELIVVSRLSKKYQITDEEKTHDHSQAIQIIANKEYIIASKKGEELMKFKITDLHSKPVEFNVTKLEI